MSQYCVIGKGNIAMHLAKKLGNVQYFPTPVTETIFYMSGPTHLNFEENLEYHLNKTIQDFLWLLPYCKKHNIRFVFCSSALVYEKDTIFCRYKRILEYLASCYPKTLCLRIFPVYGGNERYSIISKWCNEMKNDKQPTIYGDGTQKRDFIHVEDVVDQIILLESMQTEGVVDIGSGKPTSFNDIVQIINKVLNKDVKPLYAPAPKDYSKGISCVNPLPVKIDIEHGCKIILGK